MKSEDDTRNAPPSALRAAIYDLRSLYPASEGSCPPDWKEQSAREQRRFPEWASDAGLLVSCRLTAWRNLDQSSDVGGEEHHVTSIGNDSRVQKVTRGGLFGFWIHLAGDQIKQRPATPLEYLERLQLANDIWDDDIRLIRILRDPPKLHIVTTQPTVIGSPATEQEIVDLMSSFDFELIRGTRGWYRRADRLLALDAHTGNFIKTLRDVVLPIDLPMGYLSGSLADKIESALVAPN